MSEPTDVDDEFLGLPWTVYFYYGKDDELLYVGVTGCGPERGKEHSRSAVWWPRVVRAEYEHHRFGGDAYAAEARAIAELQPIYNIAGKEPPLTRTALRDHPPEGGGVPDGDASGSYPLAGNTTSTEIGADGISRLWDGYANNQDASLRRRWGLKLEQWEAIRNEGDTHGGCAACGRRNVQLVVDDDHDTGELCGTLCDSCNRKITERLRRYVKEPPSRRVAERRGIEGFFLPTSRLEAYEKGRERRREYSRKYNERKREKRERERAVLSRPDPGSVSQLDRLRAMTNQGGS
ncbi:MAG TPA: endonuclease domain-containing protein [Actinomycetota bacterium]|nr:endonuclease domain-containing protein [Actinomycetota bacterium]